MLYSLLSLIFESLKATRFWADNHLILREFKHFPKLAILAIAFTLLGALFEGFSIGFLVTFLQSLTDPDAEPIRTGIQWFDRYILGVYRPQLERFIRTAVLILLTTWIRVIFNYLSYIFTELTQQKLLDRLRKQVFEQLQSFSLSYFTKSSSGELVNTVTTEIERLKQAFSAYTFLLTTCLTVLVYAISLFLLSWELTVLAFLLFALLTVGLTTLNRKIRDASFETTKASGYFTSVAIEFLGSIRTVQAFATQDFERRRFYHASSSIYRSYKKAILFWGLVKPLADGLATTVLIGLLVLAFVVFVDRNLINVASLLTFFFVLFRLVPLLQTVNNVRAQLNSFAGSIEDVKKFLKSDDKPYFQDGHLIFPGLKSSIQFVSVDFSYEPDCPILCDINLMIEQNKMTALVGASGAGKTTLVDLIPRFFDPIQGMILIDGVDLSSFEIASVRRKMAIVSQDTFVFNTSIYNNIAYGLDEVSDSEVERAAQLANALEFIEEMPEGFETILGDRGVRLSGGQRQRIAIARALLRNPEILILDEATSALDSVSERLIQDSIEKLAIGRTVIAIAHRLSTIMRADKVVVLEAGRIVEQGRYAELLAQRGKLWNYHQAQHSTHF